MKLQFEIDFHQSEKREPLTVTWTLLKRPSALMWFKLLNDLLIRDNPISARFTGIPLAHKDMNSLSECLNTAIMVINDEGNYTIKERAEGSFNQKFSNVIHHHFEILYGDVFDPSEIYRKSSPLVQAAICELNQCIHDMEAISRESESDAAFSGVVVESLEMRQFTLPNDFYQDFDLDIAFGDIALHYGIIGKTWWEVFIDEDEEIFADGIRPLNVISGDFDIQFGEQKLTEERREQFFKFLESHGQDPKDPKLALGHLCVAKYEGNSLGLSVETLAAQKEFKRELGKFPLIGEMRLIKDSAVIKSKSFLDTYTTHHGFFAVSRSEINEQDWCVEIKACPIQLVIVESQSSELLKSAVAPFKGAWNQEHTAVIQLSRESKGPVELVSSDALNGLKLVKNVVLSPGEYCHLAYTGKGHYISALKSDQMTDF